MIRRIACAILFVVALGGYSPARSAVTFTAAVDQTIIARDGMIRYNLELNADRKNLPVPELPPMDGFTVFSSGRTQNFQLINGRVQSSIVYNYILSPKGPGTFTIGPARVTIDGTEYKTEPIKITVSKQNKAQARRLPMGQDQPASDDRRQSRLYVTSSLDHDTAYVNEAVTYTFRLYRAQRLISSPEYTAPDFPGFWMEDLPPQKRYQVKKNGVSYEVTEIRTALFPTGAGTKTIGPGRLSATVRGSRSRHNANDPFGSSLFGMFGGENKRLQTEPLTLTVIPLPVSSIVPSGNGLVGHFEITASAEVLEVGVGDPITVSVTISGEGNIKSIGRPSFDTLADLRTFSAGTSESISKEGYVVTGSKTFEEVFVPQRPGAYTLPTFAITYFDPDARTYRTVRTDTITVVATGAAVDFTIPSFRLEPEELSDLAADVRFLMTDGADLKEVSTSGAFGWSFWIGQLLPLVGLAFFGGWRRRVLSEQADPAARRRRTAYRTALMRINGARNKQAASRSVVDVAQALEEFFADRYDRAPHGLRRSEMRRILVSDGIPELTSDEFLDLLDHCDVSRYAPGESENASAELIERAQRILAEFERSK